MRSKTVDERIGVDDMKKPTLRPPIPKPGIARQSLGMGISPGLVVAMIAIAILVVELVRSC